MQEDSPHAEDLLLARRSADGEPSAAAELVETYGPFLAGVLRRAWRDGEIEDLVSEVLLRLFEDRSELLRAYRGEASLRAYLAVIARRTGLDARRRARLRGAGRIPLDDGLLASISSPPEEEGDLKRLLERLSRHDRRVLTLRYVEGLSYRDLAKVLGAPLGSAAGWVSRARERLRALWAEENRRKT